ncbi:hypothetical protein SAMN04488535_0171 [Corynebacterium mycetoides]|uniref:Secreted protein n=1 Tax=Corynebacterium mycetoides TaxID=38302 RepID=A0A1G9LIN7_9CORY|nr:hypothetical protein SAMN04488535_0171 [Corynebacterium mycetoides]
MKRVLHFFCTVILTGALAACGSAESDSTSATSETAPPSSIPTTTRPTTSAVATTTTEISSSGVETGTKASATETVATAPIFTTPGNGYRCAGTDAYVLDPANCTAANLGADPSYDTQFGPAAAINAQQELRALEEEQRLDEIPMADGGTCPAYKCGYGHDANRNPNPSSGELQTMHGCEQGYIDDQELCAAVAQKAEQYGW